jgi:hypothetical protein
MLRRVEDDSMLSILLILGGAWLLGCTVLAFALAQVAGRADDWMEEMAAQVVPDVGNDRLVPASTA